MRRKGRSALVHRRRPRQRRGVHSAAAPDQVRLLELPSRPLAPSEKVDRPGERSFNPLGFPVTPIGIEPRLAAATRRRPALT